MKPPGAIGPERRDTRERSQVLQAWIACQWSLSPFSAVALGLPDRFRGRNSTLSLTRGRGKASQLPVHVTPEASGGGCEMPGANRKLYLHGCRHVPRGWLASGRDSYSSSREVYLEMSSAPRPRSVIGRHRDLEGWR